MNFNDTYILDGKMVVPADLTTWARWFEDAGATRVVAITEFAEAKVSTVFMGLNHRFSGDGPPLIFETLVFGGDHDGAMDRYSTWEEAEAGHAAMLATIGALQ
jgi:hypothetical protein